ncbi:MAG TPA: hypothetical protein VGP77_13050 [Vicinamibacterales bacterium]|nr:hypothetical protein [Vicinamibacterales bacterium]
MSGLTWSAEFEALKAGLRTLPADLADEASAIVDNEAELAKSEIVQRYPRRTGKLREKVFVRTMALGRFGAGVQVVNSSKLAFIFENGTQARHTKLGANRGAMPPGHVFVPAIVRHRRAMYDKLKALLVKHGLLVSGDA